MENICSLKSYYKEHKSSVFLVNLFFISLIIIFLTQFIENRALFDSFYRIFHFDSIATGAFTLIFIMIYAYIFFDSITLKIVYTLLVALNVIFSLLGVGLFADSYASFLSLLPQILLFISLTFLYVISKRYTCTKTYGADNISVLASVIIPLLMLNILGRFLFPFLI